MISHNRIGQQGRIGNQLWQLAFIISQAHKEAVKPAFVDWPFSKYFLGDFSQRPNAVAKQVPEGQFHYDENWLNGLEWESDLNFSGYYQSWRYFEGCEHLIREAFEFQPDFLDGIKIRYAHVFEKPTIAIHVRRGDYVGHACYENLSPLHYLSALEQHFPDWRAQNIFIFSDDQSYTKLHFGCLPNAYFADGNEVEDLAAMSLCESFIIANSSFSWWGAWLSESKNVVRPARHFKGKMADENDTKDLYPPAWIPHEETRLNLKDVTFTLPVAFDSNDRQENLELILSFLVKNFDTNIIVMEQGGSKFEWTGEFFTYEKFEGHLFRRCEMLNRMARMATTPIIVNYDADVLFSPAQILESVRLIREGCDMCLPYSGRFVRMPRKEWYKRLKESKDIGTVAGHKFPIIRRGDAQSSGGAVFFNRESFFKGGGENQNLISFSPDDAERFERFTKLGFNVQRVNGSCYHMEHWCGSNSGTTHAFIAANRLEWQKIAGMSKSELEAEIKTWNWVEK